jgi:hypothetical protein
MKGLHTGGLVGFAFVPIDAISSRASDLVRETTERVRAKKDKVSPGLNAQHDILLERYERGAPGCELMVVPGFNSAPSS